MKKAPVLLFFLVLYLSGYGQKVGLVFSGGGAKGLAHIGVLKALEENNIPIDYIVGTSMGGVIGGLYASGYSPKQIEHMALSSNFQDWVNGKFSSDYQYFFRKKPDNPSFLSLKLEIDTGFQARFRSTLVNDIPLNFGFIELYTQASANAKNDFNKLFVPFRCIVADVFSQKVIDVDHGNLAEALRGTVTVPMIYRPVKIDGRYVFDGGLYNNFPVDIMKQDFKPDYIIGSNVSSKTFTDYPKDNDDKLMGRLLLYMLLSKSDSTSIGKNGIYIQPKMTGYSTTNFGPIAGMIKAGYDATIADMPRIKAALSRRSDTAVLHKRRQDFLKTEQPVVFKNIIVNGVGFQQKRYIERMFRKFDNKPITLTDIKDSYYRLVTNDNFETVYPRIIYHPADNTYDFEMDVKSSKNFKADIGGILSSRPISSAFLGLQYDYVNRNAFTLGANFYSGRFYESVQGTLRTDFPNRVPFYLETEFTYNNWDYFDSNPLSVEKTSPVYVEQSDRKIALKAGVPIGNGKIELQGGYINTADTYSPNDTYKNSDTLDVSRFNGFKTAVIFEKNLLNRKQYPNKGNSFYIGLQYFNGTENYIQGNILHSGVLPEIDIKRQWVTAKISNENYFFTGSKLSLGYQLEGVISNKPLFISYKESILTAAVFNPLNDSKTLILSNFRAQSYGAGGLKSVVAIKKNLEWRSEGYLFVPVQGIVHSGLQDASYTHILASNKFAASTGLVYHSFVGPLSLSFNYYDDEQKRYGVMFHAGFLIFNKRALE
ncbi:patatin-like phospholipase family protein [Mucilaginibacter sp. HMF5004]|uniref:patatin-like phospholipase family protein n=1 Tax=Mucilaginibacter rivuli TaxID=2857527 RepID=UPI001C5F836B|nr:patatin-like phospholipase family protein [Mucilaginibacter rivuli]MBW4889359.1 patatin-like phospholipase family protein [Mucilaginibacter rivuli]